MSPWMIGFSSGSRVDLDEFAQAVGLIGTQKALMTIDKNLNPQRLDFGIAQKVGGTRRSESDRIGWQRQKQLAKCIVLRR